MKINLSIIPNLKMSPATTFDMRKKRIKAN